jgi:hypothetical protein
MKQTAVEWLIGQIKGYESDCEIFQQAKEMEKQQKGYSEEEVIDIAKQAFVLGKDFGLIGTFKEWFDSIKNK